MDEADYVAGNPRWSGSPRMVVVSGCSGGGKSTLLAAMSARGRTVFPEPGRQVVKEEEFIDGDALPWKDAVRFAERCIARAAHFFNTARPDDGPVLFDRSIIDAVAFLERMGEVPASCAAAARAYRYGQRVFMVPPWPELFAADPERRHGFDAAVVEYEDLMRSYPAHGYTMVVVPKTTVAARVEFLEAELAAI